MDNNGCLRHKLVELKILIRKIKFFFERSVLEGSWSQLLIIVFAILVVSFSGGLSAYWLTDGFENWEKSVWWAFLRLTDPGYLGDDQGTVLRTISTILTVVGYVLFMGTLVALMTQWMWRLVRSLEEGRTSLSLKGHIVLAGLDQRTPEMIREMLLSDNRLNMFLRKFRQSKLTVVVLTSRPGIEAVQLIKSELGALWGNGQVIVRFGRASDPDDLERVDITNAAVMLIPQVENTQADARASTILAALNHVLKKYDRPGPLVITEFEQEESSVIVQAFPAINCQPIHINSIISKILAQSIKHAGLAKIFMELLSHKDGHEIYIKEFPSLVGKTIKEAEEYFEHVLPIGVLHKNKDGVELMLEPSFVINDADKPLFMAEDISSIEFSNSSQKNYSKTELRPLQLPDMRSRSVLIIGDQLRAASLQKELDSYTDFTAKVDVVQDFKTIDLKKYDKIVILPLSGANVRADELDQITIHKFFMLRSILMNIDHHPDILVELASTTAAEAFADEGRCDVIVPAYISAHLTAHVGLRRELSHVFDEVLGPNGCDMTLYHASVYNIEVPRKYSFAELKIIVRSYGHVLIGLRIALDENKHRRRVDLAPHSSTEYELTHNDRLVVLH